VHSRPICLDANPSTQHQQSSSSNSSKTAATTASCNLQTCLEKCASCDGKLHPYVLWQLQHQQHFQQRWAPKQEQQQQQQQRQAASRLSGQRPAVAYPASRRVAFQLGWEHQQTWQQQYGQQQSSSSGIFSRNSTCHRRDRAHELPLLFLNLAQLSNKSMAFLASCNGRGRGCCCKGCFNSI